MSDPAQTSPEVHPAAEIPGAHLIQQAEVPPLDVDGVQAATVGTVAFAIASVIMASATTGWPPPETAGGSGSGSADSGWV